MGKTANLTAVQKAIIDTLKQEECCIKAPQWEVCGKEKVWQKTLHNEKRNIQSHRVQACAGNGLQVPHSPGQATFEPETAAEAPDLGYREAALDCCFSDESKFCMSFGNQGARVWRKTGEREMPKCLKSSVKYPQSVMVWGAMSAAGVGPLCFLKGRVNAASYQEILEHFMLPSAEKLYGDEDFIFQHDLAPAHSAKTTGKWFTDHGITVLNWPANSPDLNPIENLWDIVKRKLRDARPNTLDELKAAIEASWASITPQQCHRLIASMPRRIEAVISAKGFRTKY
ncbi:Transposable element Tcb1 transposase [Labeo rohita]|uniref:Transposable element Tcb1 transposase n=1 Tax=Labeo rohita TaxID=84645 RepID=A0ABQ8L1V2_LABRO|nr:Transposable element Tcb1 transposase [Labeo rohita]